MTFEHLYYLESRGIELTLTCELAYHPEDGDGWHLPYIPEEAELISAKVGEVDIYQSLTREQVADIERDALVDHGERMREDAAEAAFERRFAA
jgi:hypothetical protein